METERRYMCSFTFQGKHYLAGGIKSGGHDKRHFRVDEGGLVQLPDLTFGFNEGRCANINDQYVAMCASRDQGKKCHVWEDNSFRSIHSTAADHYRGAMTSWEGYPLVVSGQNDAKGYTETYDTYTNLWTKQRYTRAIEKLSSFTLAKMGKTLYIFGGYGIQHQPQVYQMDDTYFWRLYPTEMESGRNGHTSIVTENKIIHVGGSSVHPVEIWEMNEGEFTITSTTFTTNHWDLYPYTFVVESDEFE